MSLRGWLFIALSLMPVAKVEGAAALDYP